MLRLMVRRSKTSAEKDAALASKWTEEYRNVAKADPVPCLSPLELRRMELTAARGKQGRLGLGLTIAGFTFALGAVVFNQGEHWWIASVVAWVTGIVGVVVLFRFSVAREVVSDIRLRREERKELESLRGEIDSVSSKLTALAQVPSPEPQRSSFRLPFCR